MELESFSSEHPEIITARKLVPALRSLYARGFARPYPKLGKWACVMTEAGMQAFGQETGAVNLVERAKTNWMWDMRAIYPSEAERLQAWYATPGMRHE